jgi:beta-galactosidase
MLPTTQNIPMGRFTTRLLLPLLFLAIHAGAAGQSTARTVIDMNGTWDFDQTTTAFPPSSYTRTIPVPGLVHLAKPLIEDPDKFFKRPERVEAKQQHNLYDIDYTPRYSWYRKRVFIPKEMEGRQGMITIRKSQYVTQVYVNGMDLGSSMACYTPVEFPLARVLKYGAENEFLVRVGDRTWLPAEAAGGTDKEKEHYLPGIWDDVFLSFTGNTRVDRMLVLPSVYGKKVTVKALIRDFLPEQLHYGDPRTDTALLSVSILEKKSGKVVATGKESVVAKRDNRTEVDMEIPMTDFTPWTPEDPTLYMAQATLSGAGGISDRLEKRFGMRDFTRDGKFFYLNGKRTILRGTNITLQRFFEDPDCSNLVWDREWVKKFLIDRPKDMDWNMMRICVGIVPDFWYDLADEYGLMFQNEWLYWQNHGWDAELRKEYTDWVWTDGCHPSIAIWDAINENWDDYIGTTLIPELKKLDPTRVWDAGYMTSANMGLDEMDEPHPYQGPLGWEPIDAFEKNPYPMGNLDYKPDIMKKSDASEAAQLVNEYGWNWTWRDGTPSKLTVGVYNYYLGPHSTREQNLHLQAYWLQLETEWLRSDTKTAGVLAFCYLTNNYGYTGDWFLGNVKDQKPSPALGWLKHAFAPSAVFINLTDERYTKHLPPHEPGSKLSLDLVGINNLHDIQGGKVTLTAFNAGGTRVWEKTYETKLASYDRTNIPVIIDLPRKSGGYTLVAEWAPSTGQRKVLSRRYIKVGKATAYTFYEPGD